MSKKVESERILRLPPMRRFSSGLKSCKALTLIEILVVMAIILMLAGITYKVVTKAMKKAEDVEDVSDTRQGNIGTLIDVIELGEGYDALPEHLKEGKFGESGTE